MDYKVMVGAYVGQSDRGHHGCGAEECPRALEVSDWVSDVNVPEETYLEVWLEYSFHCYYL